MHPCLQTYGKIGIFNIVQFFLSNLDHYNFSCTKVITKLVLACMFNKLFSGSNDMGTSSNISKSVVFKSEMQTMTLTLPHIA